MLDFLTAMSQLSSVETSLNGFSSMNKSIKILISTCVKTHEKNVPCNSTLMSEQRQKSWKSVERKHRAAKKNM